MMLPDQNGGVLRGAPFFFVLRVKNDRKGNMILIVT